MRDDKILAAIQQKDEKVMAAVMQKYAGLLWSIASAVLGNAASIQDVEECVADVFIYFWQHPDKYDPEKGKLSSWLSLVARSRAIDRYRYLAKRAEVPMLDEKMEYPSELLQRIVREEEKEKLIFCMDQLDPLEKEILVRRYFQEQKPKEIAIALDLPKKQVENRLYQAKRKLRKMMEEQEGGGK